MGEVTEEIVACDYVIKPLYVSLNSSPFLVVSETAHNTVLFI